MVARFMACVFVIPNWENMHVSAQNVMLQTFLIMSVVSYSFVNDFSLSEFFDPRTDRSAGLESTYDG